MKRAIDFAFRGRAASISFDVVTLLRQRAFTLTAFRHI